LDRALEVLRATGTPKDAFSGYQQGGPESVRRQMRAIFLTLRDSPFGIKYISPPPGPVYMSGAAPRGQLVRFPDEVLERRRGTCHDLTLFFAACAEHVGIHPLIILIPGHTFFGFWTSSADHERFWRAVRSDLPRSIRFGGQWVLDSPDDLEALSEDGSVELVETTLVTQDRARYEDACAEAQGTVRSLSSTGLDAVVDVSASRPLIQPV
jgi:hypothetical protein